MARPAREVPWLDTRENGIYYVFWHDKQTGRTNRFSLRTKDPEEAKGAYITFLADGKDMVRPRDADITVAQALDDYEREHVREKVVDQTRQRDAIAKLKAHFGDSPLRSVDIDASRVYRDKRAAGAYSGGKRREPGPAALSTIRRELVVLISAANHARKRKRIKGDDMPEVDLPAHSTKETEWLRENELKIAIDGASGKLKSFLKILYYTGARRRAIEYLEISQVDFDLGHINLAKAGEAQTKKRKPIVPIFKDIEQDLRDLVTEARAAGRTMLFGSDMYYAYTNHFQNCGLDHKGYPHIMRHTRASHMLRAGVSTWKVARLLGDTEATVSRIYAHCVPRDLAEYGGDI